MPRDIVFCPGDDLDDAASATFDRLTADMPVQFDVVDTLVNHVVSHGAASSLQAVEEWLASNDDPHVTLVVAPAGTSPCHYCGQRTNSVGQFIDGVGRPVCDDCTHGMATDAAQEQDQDA